MLIAIRAQRILTMADQRSASRNHAGETAFPLAPPSLHAELGSIYDGVIVAEDDTIVDVLPYADFCTSYDLTPRDLGAVTILPGLINCHNHLELAHMGGIAIAGNGFEDWIASLLPHFAQPVSQKALDAAIEEMIATGTVHVADVGNRAPATVYTTAERHGLGITLLMEVIGYNFPEHFTTQGIWPATTAELPEPVRKRHALLAGHALYSTHPAALVFAKQWCRSHERHFSIHLAEHTGEEEMMRHGTGRLRTMLNRQVLPADYTAPGLRPVAYAAELGLLDEQTLAVHCVHCNDTDTELLRASGASICLCPRSNALIGVGRPPVQAFLEAGIPLCLGTDSLASNHDMNLWNEARTLRDEYSVPVSTLLRMLTSQGAHALGLTESLGTLESGKLFRYAVLPEDFV